MTLATYAVGDIHGRSDLLAALLPYLEVNADDRVVFLGDYIDRGPDSRGVVDLLLDYRQQCDGRVTFLLGNHEHALQKTLDDFCRHSWLLGMNGLSTVRSYSGEAADVLESVMREAGPDVVVDQLPLPYEVFVNAMPPDHLAFFGSLESSTRTPEVVCVHAGVSSDYTSIEAESQAMLLWGQPDWWQSYQGQDEIVYGHWNNARKEGGLAQPFVCNGTYGIDCVASGELIAVKFPGLEVCRSQ